MNTPERSWSEVLAHMHRWHKRGKGRKKGGKDKTERNGIQEKARERVCMRERESVCIRERKGVCMCVCERDRERV